MVDSGGLLSRCMGFTLYRGFESRPLRQWFGLASWGAHRMVRPLLIGLALTTTSCVERYFRIESEPAGAELMVNGRRVGTAPIEQPFIA